MNLRVIAAGAVALAAVGLTAAAPGEAKSPPPHSGSGSPHTHSDSPHTHSGAPHTHSDSSGGHGGVFRNHDGTGRKHHDDDHDGFSQGSFWQIPAGAARLGTSTSSYLPPSDTPAHPWGHGSYCVGENGSKC